MSELLFLFFRRADVLPDVKPAERRGLCKMGTKAAIRLCHV